jgi:preprotein translocase subunit SecD
LSILPACASQFHGHVTRVDGARVLIDVEPAERVRFADQTRARVGAQLDVFLDGQRLGSPVIREAVTDGHVELTLKSQPPATPGAAVTFSVR